MAPKDHKFMIGRGKDSKPSTWANIKGGKKSLLARLPFASHSLLSGRKPFLVPRDNGHGFTLPFDEPLSRTRSYVRPWTVLPCQVADLPCCTMTPAQLLYTLNGITETNYCLDDTMREILSECIDSGSDLGYIYGSLRYHWGHGFSQRLLHSKLRGRQAEDGETRESAIVGDTVVNTSVPPRRIWDLYANRVLPSWVLNDHSGDFPGVQPVSHSWRPPSQRHSVLTTVNCKAWRVPIPRDTSLEDIRNELLILGAEYVWLDVLCLRQFDELLPEAESTRKKEWRLDIPTIGRVYDPTHNHGFPVIVYFSGLGRPFRAGLVDPEDNYHWLNRVWTLQELTSVIIIGGLQPKLRAFDLRVREGWPATIDHGFLELLQSQPTRDTKLTELDLEQLCRTIRRRACSNPVDKVACLSYFMLKTIPIYDPDISSNRAWDMAIENLDDVTRTELLFNDLRPRTQPDSWRPTWEEFLRVGASKHFPGGVDPRYQLKFLRLPSPSIGNTGGCAYYHEAYVIQQARICIPQLRIDDQKIGIVYVPFGAGTYALFTIQHCGASIDQCTEYILISLGRLEDWVVARKTGLRIVNGQKVMEVAKVCTMTSRSYNPPERLGGYQLVAYR